MAEIYVYPTIFYQFSKPIPFKKANLIVLDLQFIISNAAKCILATLHRKIQTCYLINGKLFILRTENSWF